MSMAAILWHADISSQAGRTSRQGKDLCSSTVYIMRSKFIGSCQNLRGALLTSYLCFPFGAIIDVDRIASKVVSLFTWIALLLRTLFCKMTLRSNPGHGMENSGTHCCSKSIPTSEDAPWTSQHFLDQPICASLLFLTWNHQVKVQIHNDGWPPCGLPDKLLLPWLWETSCVFPVPAVPLTRNTFISTFPTWRSTFYYTWTLFVVFILNTY